MPVPTATLRPYLIAFDFPTLFTEGLGWDHHRSAHLVTIDQTDYTLTAVAEKRGHQIYRCTPDPATGAIPSYALRRRIDRELAKTAREHLIIFTDVAETHQIWQWVKREPGKPAAPRETEHRRGQSGDALLQAIGGITFPLSEEEEITLTEVTRRIQSSFDRDRDRVTKRFYDRFKTEHDAFKGFVAGIQAETDRAWYASLMLNRLMFIYFIQKQGFLDGGDTEYLQH